jgi:hypothetical protein
MIRYMTLNDAMTREVLAVMDRYVRYYNERNEREVLALFSKTVSGFGTGKDEVVASFAGFRERIHADLDPANTIRLSFRILRTGGEMPAAWITGLCQMEGNIGKKSIRMDVRVTAVLVNQGGMWLFEQIHFSVPDA